MQALHTLRPGIQLELLQPPTDTSLGPVTKYAKEVLEEHEVKQISGALDYVDGLFERIYRNRKIRAEYWRLREAGTNPDQAMDDLAELYHLAPTTIHFIIWPRTRSRQRR